MAESAFHRAWREFPTHLTNSPRMWFWLAFWGVAGAATGAYFAWDRSQSGVALVTGFCLAAGLSLALTVAFTVLWLTAPVRQRNEARGALVAIEKQLRGETWALLNHHADVLASELNRLHALFTHARDSTDPMVLDATEQVFQLRIEPIVRWELLGHHELLVLFFDDTGFPLQPTYPGPPKRTALANFLERRHARLKEVVHAIEALRDSL